LHRHGSTEIDALHSARAQQRCTLGGDQLFFDERPWCDGRERGPHHTAIAEDIICVLFRWGIRDGSDIESVNYAVWSDHPRSQAGAFLVPRLPTGGDSAPTFGTPLSEYFVKEIPRMDGPFSGIEYNRLFVTEKKHIHARRGSYLRHTLIQGRRVCRKMSPLRLVATGCEH
jgi:hypothetical protein